MHTHLKGFDFVRVFRTVDTEGHVRHYMIYKQDLEPLDTVTVSGELFFELKSKHWKIEQTFRAIKQLAHAGHFFVRRNKAITKSFVLRAAGATEADPWARDEIIQSIYKLRDQLFLSAQRKFIQDFA